MPDDPIDDVFLLSFVLTPLLVIGLLLVVWYW